MSTEVVSPLRQRMMEDMNARKLGAHSQRSHIYSCRRMAGFLKRSPDTATPDDVRRFQLHLAETGASICNRNRIMTGVKFLFRVTLRRPDLVTEIYHLREPQKIPLVMSQDETRRLLAVASSLKVRVLLSLGYGCGLRAGEVVRLKVKHIDSAQKISRVEQSKGRKDRNVMLRPRRSTCCGNGGGCVRRVTIRENRRKERWLFPSRKTPGRPMTTRQRAGCFMRQPRRPASRRASRCMVPGSRRWVARFLIHVLPAGFHRIRYYGLLARGKRAENIARTRELLTLPVLPVDAIKAANITADEAQTAKHACP